MDMNKEFPRKDRKSMKKTIFCLIALILISVLAGCGTEGKAPETKGADGPKDAKEFTSAVRLEYDFVEFCLPEDRDGNMFTDMGASCAVTVDRYGNDAAAYHEYDSQASIEKKTVGEYTFDYQKFNYMDMPNWRIYVIRIVHNGEYYRFLYNVYSSEYDDAQVEKFMETIRFID